MYAALRDRRVIEYLLQTRQTFNLSGHVKEAVTIVPPFLVDSVLILLKSRAGFVAKHFCPVFRQPIPPAHLLVEHLVEVRIDNRKIQVRGGTEPLPRLSFLPVGRNAETDLGAPPEKKLMRVNAGPFRQVIDESGVPGARGACHRRPWKEPVIDKRIRIMKGHCTQLSRRDEYMAFLVESHQSEPIRQGQPRLAAACNTPHRQTTDLGTASEPVCGTWGT